MNKNWQQRVLFVMLSLGCGPALAHESITTDRPDFVESSEVVGKGHFQIETSVAMEHEAKDAPRSRTYSTPTLMRFGINETMELRLETDGLMKMTTWEDGDKHTERGTSDLAFGLKWHVRTQAENESGPSMAWLFHVDAPTGTKAFRGQGLRPSARLVAEWDFGSWSLGVMPGVYIEHNEDNKRYAGGIFAVTAGKSLTDKLRAFAEFSGQQLTMPKNGGNVVTLDGGLAYLLSDSVQVDVAFAKGMSKATPRQQWTVGLSMYF
jgi:hypothetical protein